MSAAEKIEETSPPFRKPKTKETEQLEQLTGELLMAITEIAYSESRPPLGVVHRAARLGQLIIGIATPSPNALNITAHDDKILFSLFGPEGRSCDCWVSDSKDFVFVTGAPEEDETDGSLPIENVGRLLEWLAGRQKSAI